MNNWKYWFTNGLPVFVSTGIVSLKAILDSWLLGKTSPHDLQAFALAFPIVILTNTIAVSLANGLTGTASQWIEKQQVQGKPAMVLYLVAVVLGIAVAFLVNLLIDPFILWFDAEKYRASITAFCSTSYLWLPFQFALAVQSQMARFIGLFKSSSLVLTICCFLGMSLSYYLLFQHPQIQPLSAVVISNSTIAFFSSLILLIQLWPKLCWEAEFSGWHKLRDILAQGGEIFYTTMLGQTLAVLFIFVITQQFAQQGEDVIGLLAYLTRIEQLILMLAFSFISVMLPDMAKILKDGRCIQDYIRQASSFLLVCGFVCAVISLTVIFTQVTFDESERLNTMWMMAALWFSGTVVQGVVVLLSQLINVLLSPKSAVVLNLIRFVLLGIPLVYIGGTLAGEIGIAVALACLHFASWPIYHRKINQLLLS